MRGLAQNTCVAAEAAFSVAWVPLLKSRGCWHLLSKMEGPAELAKEGRFCQRGKDRLKWLAFMTSADECLGGVHVSGVVNRASSFAKSGEST
ncbi:hypothetical protein Ancab_001706 [Ancistrocladus abbreviatus]